MSTENPFPTPSEKARALAANLRERARTVEQVGDPVIQTFDRPSFRELQDDERRHADQIAEYAAHVLFGVSSCDRLTNRRAIDLEGGAMYLVRRSHPDWMQAAHDQAVETLLASDEYRALMRERGLAEARVIAHRLVTNVRAALIGVLENSQTVAPATYLKIQAGVAEAEAR